MMTQRAFRHGDVALIQIETLPDGCQRAKTKVLMTGSGGNAHTFDHGTFYPLPQPDGPVIGYFKATARTTLFHVEHGVSVVGKTLREARIPAGIYAVRRQQEETNDGLRPVED